MNNFDEFIKNKLEEQKVEFDQNHWQDALNLIESDKKKKRRFLLWFWVIALMLGGGASAYFYNYQIKKEGSANLIEQNDREIPTVIKSNDVALQSEDSIKNSNRSVIKNSNIELSESQQKSTDEKQLNFLKKVLKSIQTRSIKSQKLKNNLKEDAPLAINSATLSKKIKEANLVEKNGHPENNSEGINIAGNARTEESNELKKKYDISIKNDAPNNVNASPKSVTAFTSTFDNLLPLPIKNVVIISNASNINISALEFNPIIKDDLRNLKGEFGISAAFGNSNKLWRSRVGIYAKKPINDQWALSGNFSYVILTGHFNPTKQFSAINYSFDSLKYINSLQPSALHAISLTLALEKRLNNGALLAGIGIQKLIAVRGQLINNSKTLDTREIYNTPLWIKNYGFSELNFPVFIGYNRLVSQRFSLNASVGYLFKGIYASDFAFPDDIKSISKTDYFAEIGITYQLIKR